MHPSTHEKCSSACVCLCVCRCNVCLRAARHGRDDRCLHRLLLERVARRGIPHRARATFRAPISAAARSILNTPASSRSVGLPVNLGHVSHAPHHIDARRTLSSTSLLASTTLLHSQSVAPPAPITLLASPRKTRRASLSLSTPSWVRHLHPGSYAHWCALTTQLLFCAAVHTVPPT